MPPSESLAAILFFLKVAPDLKTRYLRRVDPHINFDYEYQASYTEKDC